MFYNNKMIAGSGGQLIIRFLDGLRIEPGSAGMSMEKYEKISQKIIRVVYDNLDKNILSKKLYKMGGRSFSKTDDSDGVVDSLLLEQKYQQNMFPPFVYSASFLYLFWAAMDSLSKTVKSPSDLLKIFNILSIHKNNALIEFINDKKLFTNIKYQILKAMRPIVLLYDAVNIHQDFNSNELELLRELKYFYEKDWSMFTFELAGDPLKGIYLSWKINPYFMGLAKEQRNKKFSEFLANDMTVEKFLKTADRFPPLDGLKLISYDIDKHDEHKPKKK